MSGLSSNVTSQPRFLVRLLALAAAAALLLLAACGGAGQPASQAGQSSGAGAGGGEAAAGGAGSTATGSGSGSRSAAGGGTAGEGEQALQPIPIKLSYTAVSAVNLPMWVAKEQGLFEKYGLETGDLLYIATSSKAVQALLAGDVEVTTPGANLIDARIAGGDVAYFAGLGGRFVFSLYGQPDLDSVQDLRGKVAAATRAKSSTDNALHKVLEANGLVPGQDVQITYVGGVPEILAALSNKSVAAGILSPPTTLKARKAGLKELVNLAAQHIAFTQTAFGARRSWLEANPEAATRFVKAISESIYLLKRNPEVAKEAMAKYAKVEDPEVAQEAYDQFAPTFLLPPVITPEELAADIEFSEQAKGKQVDPSEFYYSKIIDDLKAAGFFDQFKS